MNSLSSNTRRLHLPLTTILRHLTTASTSSFTPNPKPKTPKQPPQNHNPHFQPASNSSVAMFNSLVNSLCKARKFDSVWDLVIHRIDNKDIAPEALPDRDTFGILIRRYARSGMPLLSIETYEFASRLESIHETDDEPNLFVLLLDSLCKAGDMTVAVDYCNKLKYQGSRLVSSTWTYNALLKGWFHWRNLEEAERLWIKMKRDNVKPTVVTYGTVVEGLCRMYRFRAAMDLVNGMKGEGIEPDVVVYNLIIDALGEAGMVKEALGFMERLSILESGGPTVSTYNSLIKGFCRAGDIEGAGKMLKKMISEGFLPATTTYNYFLKYFSRTGQVEECLNLFTKLKDSGYVPNGLTYHLLIKMLCELDRIDSAMRVKNEMRDRGYDMDVATSDALLRLMCERYRFDDAIKEFKYMIQRGIIVPESPIFEKLTYQLKKRGLTRKLNKIHDLMESEQTRKENEARISSIMQKAEAVADSLKAPESPSKRFYRRSSKRSYRR